MKLPISPICLALFVSVAANCQVATPSVGYVRYAADGVRAIYGLEGNYIVGRSMLAPAEAVSFSDVGGLIFDSGSLSLVDPTLVALSTTRVEDSDVLVRMDGNLNTAIAWLPASHVLVHWNRDSFVRTPVSSLPAEGIITSVRKLDPKTASLLASKPDGTIVRYRLSLQTGELKSSTPVPNAIGYAFETGDRIICFKEGKLSVLTQTGETLETLAVPLDSNLVIEQASARCLHLNAKKPGQDWLLHLENSDSRLYRLPSLRKGIPSAAGTTAEPAQ
jgi:hypothetical protein